MHLNFYLQTISYLEVGLDRLEIKSLGFQFGGEQCLKSQSRFLITYDLGDNG